MPFNAERFERSKFAPRTARVSVPALASFFDADEEAMEAGKRQSSGEQIVKAIAASGIQAEAVRRALGLTKDTPGEIAKRLEMLVMGAVSPAMTLPQAVKLAEAFPVEFLALTNEITALTGRGADLVKPAAASPQTTV